MRVCFFVGNLNQAGGTERVSSVIANELQRLGYHIYILNLQCGDKPFFELSDGVKVNQIFTTEGRGLLRLPIVIMKLRRYLQEQKIDVLIDVDSMLTLYTLPATLGLNIRHICWEHFNYNVDLGKLSRRLARKLAARFADDVITLTERDKQLWLTNTICKAKMTSIPNPVTITLPTEVNKKKEKIFLAVGRLTHIKGFDLLLKAWAKVSPLHRDWRLRIVGDGEDKAMLEQLRYDLNIETSTELVPNTNNISLHYQQAAFLVMSSRFEGFGLVLIEAQTYGMPVISFDCDVGPAEIIKHEKTGWLCNKNDIFSLSSALQKAANLFCSDEYLFISDAAILSAKKYSLGKIIMTWDSFLNEKG